MSIEFPLRFCVGSNEILRDLDDKSEPQSEPPVTCLQRRGVTERERERERKGKREREGERKRGRERERKRERGVCREMEGVRLLG